MATIISPSKLSLSDVEDKFKLQEVMEPEFFPECVENLPQLSELEMQIIDRAKANYKYLSKDLVLEDLVKMVVVSPLLDLAGFYQPPFKVKAEYEVSLPIEDKDEDTIIKGRIDILVTSKPIWIAVIESKRSAVSLQPAIPQALVYMVKSPQTEQPTFGLVTNGASFIFIKLVKGETLRYALSKAFDIWNPGNYLYDVLSILKRIAAVTANS
ncbi:MAG: restriction endonuclease subunit R [Moorea sp. SIO3I7]|uniref:type I restriction endonuclease n=1 Tax=Moorena sp. SIO3I8 TaxID=2607833 RepID=UPI0013C157EA|nr:restriction endonuclease subunit R [Moorena sp. SIO3I8]NEN94554.1 restriction endonuclease subunit R [Moorena sp. SIO3I7]NEO06280.1 restriction endonuclease subunit R [Moorena sp. SIO3I8]